MVGHHIKMMSIMDQICIPSWSQNQDSKPQNTICRSFKKLEVISKHYVNVMLCQKVPKSRIFLMEWSESDTKKFGIHKDLNKLLGTT